jgi:hypothetical protein
MIIMDDSVKTISMCIVVMFVTSLGFAQSSATVKTPIVDTGQIATYDTNKEISYPKPGDAFYGQDAQYAGNQPSYRDNGDGTVTDLVTGLMWSKAVDSDKVTLEEAEAAAEKMTLGGYTDWRVPTIKELYSLIDFRGNTGFSRGQSMHSKAPSNAISYINTDYFDFMYGCTDGGERYIDAQWLSRTKYVSTTMDNMETLFGVNFADGRIKGYGFRRQGTSRHVKTFYVRFVRGNAYGDNDLKDNGDGTVTDSNTGLMWMKTDSGKGMNWKEALAYAEDSTYAGYSDWRLPNAKELQYLVDYTRSPDTTRSPAIDPVFQTSSITNEAEQKDYPFFWTSTTHLDGPVTPSGAVYISFGRAIGKMQGHVMDVHGAGAQRSDPKTGSARIGHGPQGDAQRVQNFVRLVRGGSVKNVSSPPEVSADTYPEKIRILTPKPTKPVLLGPMSNMESRQGPQGPPREDGGSFVEHLDRNNDGKVSRSEFDGPEDHFDLLDKNHDGYLSEDEAPTGPPNH